MRARRGERTYDVSFVIEKTGMSRHELRVCMARKLVSEPLTAADMAELRRIRRLRELGVNMAGIEVILHMRQRIQRLQAAIEEQQRVMEQFYAMPREDRWQRLLTWERDAE
jgi:DNA-binding transcriptional MerR regulator